MNQVVKETEINLLKALLGKPITSLIANDVSFEAGQHWFDAYSLRIKSIPSYGYVQVRYDFNELDLGFSHSLVVEQAEFSKSSSTIKEPPFSFKATFENEFITNQVFLLGQEFLMSDENKEETKIEHNELLLLSNTMKILIIPEYSTARTLFTTDNKTIESYFESGWRKEVNKKKAKRIEIEVK